MYGSISGHSRLQQTECEGDGNESEDEELITVSFSDETIFEKKTVKNGGADISTQKASFSDITEGTDLELTGHYEGENFYTTQATIYHFIH